MNLNQENNYMTSINPLMLELKNYASEISFPNEFEGKFIMHALIDNHHVLFFNSVGAIVEVFLLHPSPHLSNETQKKIGIAKEYIQSWLSNHKEQVEISNNTHF